MTRGAVEITPQSPVSGRLANKQRRLPQIFDIIESEIFPLPFFRLSAVSERDLKEEVER